MVNTINPDRHHIHDTSLSTWLKERFHDDNFFTYRHARWGNWVVGYFVHRGSGQFIELEQLARLSDFNKDCVQSIEAWYHGRGITGREACRRMLSRERAELTADYEFMEEARAQKQYLAKRVDPLRKDCVEWNTPGFRTLLSARN